MDAASFCDGACGLEESPKLWETLCFTQGDDSSFVITIPYMLIF